MFIPRSASNEVSPILKKTSAWLLRWLCSRDSLRQSRQRIQAEPLSSPNHRPGRPQQALGRCAAPWCPPPLRSDDTLPLRRAVRSARTSLREVSNRPSEDLMPASDSFTNWISPRISTCSAPLARLTMVSMRDRAPWHELSSHLHQKLVVLQLQRCAGDIYHGVSDLERVHIVVVGQVSCRRRKPKITTRWQPLNMKLRLT